MENGRAPGPATPRGNPAGSQTRPAFNRFLDHFEPEPNRVDMLTALYLLYLVLEQQSQVAAANCRQRVCGSEHLLTKDQSALEQTPGSYELLLVPQQHAKAVETNSSIVVFSAENLLPDRERALE
jgi:hypothetical protein